MADQIDKEIGELLVEVGLDGEDLVVAHKQQRIYRPEWRRRGFAKALLRAAEDWYLEFGVSAILKVAEGDGSLFAACHGFDFCVDQYKRRAGFEGLEERSVRAKAVRRMIDRPLGIYETTEDGNGWRRRTPRQLLSEVAESGAEEARLVEDFSNLARLDGNDWSQDGFTSPAEIAAFGSELPVAILGGETLGRAALCHTDWIAIKRLDFNRPRPET